LNYVALAFEKISGISTDINYQQEIMQESGIKSAKVGLDALGITANSVKWNLSPAELTEEVLKNEEGVLINNGAIMLDTGKFTGRAPKDKFVVKDETTEDSVWWGNINQPTTDDTFEYLLKEMKEHLRDRNIYVRDGFAGADPKYRLNCRFINTMAWQNLFCYNMFIRPEKQELENFEPDFTVLCAPEFTTSKFKELGLRQENFAIVNFKKKMIIIGGSAYAGEMKKGIFSVLNYILPHEHKVLAMHCSANVGDDGDTAIFFGLSGTGKTTLSADPNRGLIGDDEHGWTDETVFNFEGGCYAKVVNLTRESEPQIFDAIRFGAIVENTRCFPGTRDVDYTNTEVTENTRVSYPLHYIDNSVVPSIANVPKNIFFLTADAFGILPPISRLNPGQAMYHFISGYTAKVAGTEMGVTEPQATFSACFGAAFLPLHPTVYAELLGEKMKKHDVNVWLVNTGWTGGPYGIGSRIKLKYTRAMITAALDGSLNEMNYKQHTIFGMDMPTECPGVPQDVLSPLQSWGDPDGFYKKANSLADQFNENFKKFEDYANDEILSGAPKPNLDYAK
jgi:phosphoenolpyruvate carboxykinase (ATP)